MPMSIRPKRRSRWQRLEGQAGVDAGPTSAYRVAERIAMRRLTVVTLFTVAASLGLQQTVHAQAASLKSELLKDWTELKPVMMAISAAMPEEKFTYKSTPAQRDYGQQIMHVATGNMMYLRFLGGTAAAPAFNRTGTSK